MPGFNIQGMGGKVGNGIGVSGRQEYYYNYFWEINDLFGTNFTLDQSLISLKDATLPTFTVNREQIVGSSLEYKFAKSVVWEDLKVSWYDTKKLINYIRDWRSSVWTPQTGLKMANEYKKRSSIEYYLPTGKSPVVWVLYNSWPSQIRNGDLTYTNSEVKLVEVTVTYDWAEERFS